MLLTPENLFFFKKKIRKKDKTITYYYLVTFEGKNLKITETLYSFQPALFNILIACKYP